MKIAVIGSACTGKSTYIKDFIEKWNMYKLCERPRYTDLIKEKGLKLNEDRNEDSQLIILNSLIDQLTNTPKNSNTIFDRSVLDNLVYTLWLNAKGKVSNAFVKQTILLVKQSLVFYDILFFIPITKQSPIVFGQKENRSVSEEFRSEIDNIFKSLVNQYNKNETTFYPFDDKLGCPAIIEIFGDRKSRISLTELYIGKNGKVVSESDNLLMPGDPLLTDFT